MSAGQGLYCLVPVPKELGQSQEAPGECGEKVTENFGIKALGVARKERTDIGNTLRTHFLFKSTHRKTDAKDLEIFPT